MNKQESTGWPKEQNQWKESTLEEAQIADLLHKGLGKEFHLQ